MHAAALVLEDKFWYLLEFKKVISLLVALSKDSKLCIVRSFFDEKFSLDPIALTISLKGKGPFFSKNWFSDMLLYFY